MQQYFQTLRLRPQEPQHQHQRRLLRLRRRPRLRGLQEGEQEGVAEGSKEEREADVNHFRFFIFLSNKILFEKPCSWIYLEA